MSKQTQEIALLDAIDARRKRAATKSVDVSLNELADMYSNGELRIDPDYQRLFRWSVSKQSQFMESLILEMPIPPIFVIERAEGEWELIDGLQRISSYLHFRGELNSKVPKIKPGQQLTLEGCDILAELNGQRYDDLPTVIKIRLKRHFLRVELVRKESDDKFKYFMFKRLNTGGEPLSNQEVRNCTVRLLGPRFNDYIIECSKYPPFRECITALSGAKMKQMGDVELVLRFFAFKNNFAEFKHDVAAFLTEYMESVTDESGDHKRPFDYEKERTCFEKLFGILGATLGKNTCLRWINGRFGGQFSMHHFEAITLGTAKVLDSLDHLPQDRIGELLTNIKKDDEFAAVTKGGGQNSPGLYRAKINFVENRLRAAL